jgi:hypothetical protein
MNPTLALLASVTETGEQTRPSPECPSCESVYRQKVARSRTMGVAHVRRATSIADVLPCADSRYTSPLAIADDASQ